MPGISETSKWEEDIYEIQTTDVVLGGSAGISNIQAMQLANRTSFLKKQQDIHADSENPHSQYLLKTESVLQQQQLAGEMQHLFEGSLEDHTHSEDPHPQYISLPKDTADGMAVVFREGKGWGAEFIPGVPVGTIEYFAMTKPPPGYMKADGAAIGRQTYPELFAAIGTTFGAGDGSATFNLPDLRGEFIRGWDDGRNVDTGRVFGSAQGDAIRNITGTAGMFKGIEGGSGTGAFTANFGAVSNGGHGANSVNGAGAWTFDASRVVPTADENRPRNIALLACIKAFDAAVNPELIDITELAQEVADKLNRSEAFAVDQTWQNMKSQRALNTVYTNTTDKPIFLSVMIHTLSSVYAELHVDGVVVSQATNGGGAGLVAQLSAVVMPESTYKVMGAATVKLNTWAELR